MGFENLGVLELTPTTKYANARPDPDCTVTPTVRDSLRENDGGKTFPQSTSIYRAILSRKRHHPFRLGRKVQDDAGGISA
jgi:hypothetical protein